MAIEAATEETTTETPEGAEAEAETETIEEWDEERARATIAKQRASEKALKAQLAEARQAQEELEAIKAAEAEAQKTLAQKLEEREAKISELETLIMERDIKDDFYKVARDRGIKDLSLAYLAAKEQGLLGQYDPKTGAVGAHDLDKLEELFPTLAGEESGTRLTGDAGIQRRSVAKGVNTQFNESIRQRIRR